MDHLLSVTRKDRRHVDSQPSIGGEPKLWIDQRADPPRLISGSSLPQFYLARRIWAFCRKLGLFGGVLAEGGMLGHGALPVTHRKPCTEEWTNSADMGKLVKTHGMKIAKTGV